MTTAATALLLPLLGVGASAAPAAEPHPAAPIAGCAVTQASGTTYSAARGVTLKHRRTRVDNRRVVRNDRGWRAVVRARVVWRGAATVKATSAYASTDCDVADQEVSATRRYTSRVHGTARRAAVAPTKAAALRQARQKVRKATRRQARAQAVALAADAAALKARMTFLATLPARDEAVTSEHRRVTGKQACPARLATRPRGGAAQKGKFVPQFTAPAMMWVCTYETTRRGVPRLTERRKVTGAAKGRLLAGIRSLQVPDERLKVACTAETGPLRLVAHAAADGLTAVVVQEFGCREARLTADPGGVAAGARTGRGVPRGFYDTTHLLRQALARS